MNAFDELRFGPQRTLNLRDDLPSATEAVRRADAWLQEQQVRGAKEVLVITGRGSQSAGGTAVIRPAVEKLLMSLRRRGVVAAHNAHNPGAFAVQLAPLRARMEAPPRRREQKLASPPPVEIVGLGRESNDLLRQLAERSLHGLGVTTDEAGIRAEMQRYFGVIVRALPSGARTEVQLRTAIKAAIAGFD